MTAEDLDRIKRAEEMCDALEKENRKLKLQLFSLRNERNTFLAQNEQYEKDLIELNEANSWHYVKDGDLPKDESNVLLYFGNDDYNKGLFIRGRFCCGDCGWFNVDDVVAWKELVPPKE